MSQSENLPEVSESQRIGMLAKKCFVANMPTTWAETELAGTEDFGFDYQIQDVSAGYARNVFRAQLKGTLHPKLNVRNKCYSISLATSTINLYRKTKEPVLLILADLTVDPEVPKNCHLYYVWIHQELRRVSLDKNSVTLHVPVANQLTTISNLSSELERMLKLAQVGTALDISLEERCPELGDDERATLIENIPANFSERGGSFFEVMTESPEESWPSPKPCTMPWHFREADHHLKDGDVDGAEAALNDAEKMLANALPLERSDYWFLRGQLFQLKGKEESARDAYAKSTLAPNRPPKHVVSWAESEIRLSYKEDAAFATADFSHVLAKLTDTCPMTLGMRARVLAAGGKFEEAMECANSFGGVESLMAKAVIHCMQSQFNQTLEVCEQGLQQTETVKYGRQIFLMLRARARFSLALNLVSSDYDTQLPPSGPAKTNVDLLAQVWEDVQVAVKEFERVGWLSNIDYLADIWSSTAIMLGKQKETLPLIKSAGNARPHLVNLQRALELVAVHCGDLKVALEANSRLPFDDLSASHHVTLLHELKRDEDCVNLFGSLLPKMNTGLPTFGEAAARASLSAHRIVNTSKRDEWLTILNNTEHLKPFGALAEYFAAVEDNSLASNAAVAKLWERYESLGNPLPIAQQLIGILDPSSPNEAQKCKQVAARLKSASLLNLRFSLVLAGALATLSEWQPLLDLCIDVKRRFSGSTRLAAFEALALEKLGNTAEALEMLKTLIGQGVSHPLAINTYINIVIRCGFGQEAISTVSNILSAASTREQKLDCLRLLFNLVHMTDPSDLRAFDFAIRYGSLCEQSDEIEEGMFLSMILRARLAKPQSQGKIDNDELNKRYSRFFEAFPNSSIIRRGEVSDGATGEEIMQAIKDILGPELFDQDRINNQMKLARELKRGEIPFPYAWRPQHILMNVPNLPLLWEIGKGSRHEERQYQLTMNQHDWEASSIKDIRRMPPLLDLTALLVIHDLNLFELLFQIFPKICIAQATVSELAKMATPLAGGISQEKCASLLRILRENFEKIQQPHAVKPVEKYYLHWASEEIKLILKREDLQLYSDDLFFRIYCSEDHPTFASICTLDIISALADLGLLTAGEAAQKIAMLCAWKVGIVIEAKFVAYAIPETLDQAKSPTVAAKSLRLDADAMAVLNRFWDPSKEFKDSLLDASKLLHHLIQENGASLNKMTAAMDVWCGKARLRSDSKSPIGNIALLVAWTARRPPQPNSDFSSQLRRVYLALVEMEYGDRMDVNKEKDSLVALGRMCLEMDLANNLEGNDRTRVRLGTAFTEGTSEEAAFIEGYSRASEEAALRVINKQ